jgi:hypothetical protein
LELRQVIDRPKHCVSKRLLVFAYVNNPYWFLNTLRENGYRVDVVGTPVRYHIAQRILLTTTKLILSNLASLQRRAL